MAFQDPAWNGRPAFTGGRRVRGPAFTGGRRVQAAPELDRTMGERFGENFSDAFARSGAGQLSRSIDPNANGFDLGDVWQTPQIREGSPIDRGLDIIAPNRGFLRGTDTTTEADRRERARRERYDARAAADPIRNQGDRAAFFGGQIVGSAFSPDSWVGVGKTVATRVAGNAAVAAGTDALLQGSDVLRGIQDDYRPTQTLLAGGIGGIIQGGVELGRPAFSGGRKVVERASRAFTGGRRVMAGDVPSFDGRAMDAGPVYRPQRPQPRPMPERGPQAPAVLAPVIGGAAREFGVPEGYMTALAARESAFDPNARAGTSSATGLYQFIDDTWLRTLERHGPALGLGNVSERIRTNPQSVLALRTDPALAARAAALLTRDNAAHLRRGLGREPTEAELYSAHFFGPAGALRMARADPRASAADLMPDAARANRPIFYGPDGRPRTVAEVFGNFAEDFEGGASARMAPAPFEPTPYRGPALPEWSPTPAERVSIRRLPVEESITGSGLEGFRVDVPGRTEGRVMGAVMGDVRPDGTWRVRNAELPADLRGQGLGVESYLRAAREADAAGQRLTSDSEVTPAAAQVWDALGRRGWAVERNPLAEWASRANQADTMGMGPVSLRTPDDSPVYRVTGAPASRPAFTGGRKVAARPAFTGGRKVDPQKLNVDLGQYAGRLGGAAPTLPTTGQTIGGLRDAPRPGAVPRGEGPGFTGRTVSELADDLRAALGLTHRQGRVTAKRALGEYDTGSGVVRTRAVGELDVLAHEATHALEFERKGPALAAALRAHARELEALAYLGAAPGVKREEGFAEFGRWYLTNPDHARRIAPQFYDAFEAAMKADAPDVLAGMQGVQRGYQDLLSSASIDVAKQSIAYTGNKDPIRNLIDEFRERGPGATLRRIVDDLYTAVVDDLHPISVAERKLGELYLKNSGQKLDLKRAASPYALARLSREAYAAGHSALMNGVTPYHGLDPEGPSFADALATAGIAEGWTAGGKNRLLPKHGYKDEALREFAAYLIARRMVHEWDRYSAGDLPNPPDRNTRQFHEQVIADAEAAHPTWAEAAEQVYGFLNNLWRFKFESGLISRESYENGLNNHPDYVPFLRDMSDKGPGGKLGKPRGAMQFAGGVKAFEGSNRDIISPLTTIMREAYETYALAKRNDVMKALDDLAQAAGRGSGAIVERLPAKQIEAVTINAADALEKAAEELGLSGRDLANLQKFADDAASQDATLQIFRQSEFSPRKGEAVVFVWRDGKKTPLLLGDGEFGQQMFDALAGMNRDLRNVAVDIMAAGTQALRYGVTLSPEFMGANLVRDALATWINTDVGFVPGLDTIRGGAAELAQGRTAQRYATAGGMRGGANTAATAKPFPRTDAEAEAQLQHLRRKGWKVKRFASWRGLAELTDLSETSTRLGVFKKGFDQAKARGLTDYEALIESGFTSRDYLDFGRRGSKMMTASRLVTFLNAALQGLDKSTRVLTAGGNLKALLTPLSREARTPAEKRALGHAYKAWAKVATLGAIGLGLRMLYADDPEYQEIGDRLRATHWIFRAGGQWVFIPKPFELATLSNILERGYEGAVLGDPTAGERLLSDFRHTIAPPSEIPALSVPFHLAANRDYLGRPIVPDHLKGTVDPERQFTAYTSDLGKLIGRTFGVSPAQVDYVITGFGGSLGRYGLQGSNLIGEAVTGRPRTAAGPEDWFLSRRFVRDPARGATSQAEFWDGVSRDGGTMTRAEGTFRALMKDGKDAEAVAYVNALTPQERGYVLAKVFSQNGSSRLHPMVRAQNAVSVYGDFRTALREGEVRGPDGQPIPLTPRERRQLDSALADLAMAEMRNALIETGVRGWAQKQPMDAYAIAARIGRTNPAVAFELQGWLERASAPTIFHPQALAAHQQGWAAYAPVLTGQADPAALSAAMQQERLTSGDRLDRYREAQRFAGQRAFTGGRRVAQ